MKLCIASPAETGAPAFGPEAAAYEIKTSGGFSHDFRLQHRDVVIRLLRELNSLQNSVAVHRGDFFDTKLEWKSPEWLMRSLLLWQKDFIMTL